MKSRFIISWLAVLVAAVIVLGGCANMGSSSGVHPYWPKPPDTARFIYESAIRSEFDIIRESKTDVLKNQITGYDPRKNSAFVKPYDVAARDGRVLVSDSAGEVVVLFDIPTGQMVRMGRGELGKLQHPSGVFIDHRAHLFVCDAKARRVVVYNGMGHFIRTLGGPDIFVRPSDVAVSRTGDRIYVSDFGGIDSDQHRVVAMDADGKVLFTIGKHGNGPGEFHLPSSLAVAPDDTLYVLDSGNFRVQAFDKDGKFLRMWGKVGVDIGDLARPRGIAVDSDGYVYVTDGTFANFQIFTPDGQLLMWIGNSGLEDKPGQYALPAGIAIDETNRVYIVDQMYNKVEVLRRLTDDESTRLAKNLPLLKKSSTGPASALALQKGDHPKKSSATASPAPAPDAPVPAGTPVPPASDTPVPASTPALPASTPTTPSSPPPPLPPQ